MINDLEGSFGEYLHIQATDKRSEEHENDDYVDKNACREFELPQSTFLRNCLDKCTTFPYPGLKLLPNMPLNKDDEPETATSMSHNVKSKKQHKTRNKKNGKKGKKGSNYLRGNNGRDKEQIRKAVGSLENLHKSWDVCEIWVDNFDRHENFEVGQSESNCGSSYLKKSVAKLHYSVKYWFYSVSWRMVEEIMNDTFY